MDTHDWNVSTIFEIRSFGASASSLLALQELLGVEILMGLQQYIFLHHPRSAIFARRYD